MSHDLPVPEERALAGAGPFIGLGVVGLLAMLGLGVSMFVDPGLPAHLSEQYMRVAGGLVTPAFQTGEAGELSASFGADPPGAVRVPDLSGHGFALDGGTRAEVGGAPAAVAIYRSPLQDLLVWSAVAGRVESLPETADVRVHEGRSYYLHYKSTTTIVAWQDGAQIVAVTASLPAEQVMTLARAATAGGQPAR